MRSSANIAQANAQRGFKNPLFLSRCFYFWVWIESYVLINLIGFFAVFYYDQVPVDCSLWLECSLSEYVESKRFLVGYEVVLGWRRELPHLFMRVAVQGQLEKEGLGELLWLVKLFQNVKIFNLLHLPRRPNYFLILRVDPLRFQSHYCLEQSRVHADDGLLQYPNQNFWDQFCCENALNWWYWLPHIRWVRLGEYTIFCTLR